MKILLAVPSKKRAEVLRQNTLKWIPYVGHNWLVFVEKECADEYRKAGVPADRLMTLPQSNCGLGYSKEVIRQYAEGQGYDAIFKIDDDIKGWTKWRARLQPEPSAAHLRNVIARIVQEMEKEPLLAAVAFPYAFQLFTEYEFKKTKRTQTAYFTRTEDFHADRNISVFEDFAVGLNAIVNGRLVYSYGLAGIMLGVQVGAGEGGHQSFNRMQKVQLEKDELRKIYPDIKFRTVEKRWKEEPDLRSIKNIGLY